MAKNKSYKADMLMKLKRKIKTQRRAVRDKARGDGFTYSRLRDLERELKAV